MNGGLYRTSDMSIFEIAEPLVLRAVPPLYGTSFAGTVIQKGKFQPRLALSIDLARILPQKDEDYLHSISISRMKVPCVVARGVGGLESTKSELKRSYAML